MRDLFSPAAIIKPCAKLRASLSIFALPARRSSDDGDKSQLDFPLGQKSTVKVPSRSASASGAPSAIGSDLSRPFYIFRQRTSDVFCQKSRLTNAVRLYGSANRN